MPPKIVGTTGKHDGSKRLKDLELLLICVMSNVNTIEVDYDEFVKKDDAPTRSMALSDVERMSNALGVTVKAAPRKAANSGGQASAKPAPKKRAAKGSEDEADDN